MGRERLAKQERREARVEYETQRSILRRYAVPVTLVLLLGGALALRLYVFNAGEVAPQASAIAASKSSTQVAVISTDAGDITVELDRAAAPKTVENFIKLAKQNFYDGTTWHRVVADFVIQGGDPNSKDNDPSNDGQGGPGYTFADEINPKAQGLKDADIKVLEAQGYTYDFSLPSKPMAVGALAMANSGPSTNGSQFFIVTTQDQPHLNGKHTVFGRVTKGMDVVRKVKQGDVIKHVAISE